MDSSLVAMEFFEMDGLEETVKQVLELTEELTVDERAYLEAFRGRLQKSARLARRVRDGETHLDDMLYVNKLQRTTAAAASSGPPLSVPPPGSRRAPRFSRAQTRSAAEADSKALDRWLPRLQVLLVRGGAPVVEGAEDLEATVRIVCGRTRAGTLRLRVRAWEEFVRWLMADRARVWPAAPTDYVDYLRALVAAPAAKSVVTHFAATCHWLVPRSGSQVAKEVFGNELVKQAFAWAEVQLDDPRIATRKAPRLLVGLIISMEIMVVSEETAVTFRAAAWMRLLKIYGALRWDDFKRLTPQDLVMRETGLSGRLTRTKTTGIGKKVRELPLFIPAEASISGAPWLSTGFAIFQKIGKPKRDFMLPRPEESLDGFTTRMATDNDAATLSRLMFVELKVPKKMRDTEGNLVWTATEEPLMDPLLAAGWTNHSERATLTSLLAALGVDKARRDALGRWSPSGSDDYVRTYKCIVKDLLGRFCQAVASGRAFHLFDEEEAIAVVAKRLTDIIKVESVWVEPAIAMLTATERAITQDCAAQDPEPAPTEIASLPPLTDIEDDDAEEESGKYIIVYTRGRAEARLHLAAGCWRARRLSFRDFEILDVDTPSPDLYNRVCKDCWPLTPIQPDAPADTESAGSGSSSSGDSEAAEL